MKRLLLLFVNIGLLLLEAVWEMYNFVHKKRR